MLGNKTGGLLELPKLLFIGFFVIILLIALLPSIVEMSNSAKQSDSLNCAGYNYGANESNTLSYNSSKPTNSIGCMSITILPGLLVLGIIMAILLAIFYGRSEAGGGQDQYV